MSSSGGTTVYRVTVTYNANGVRFRRYSQDRMWAYTISPIGAGGYAWCRKAAVWKAKRTVMKHKAKLRRELKHKPEVIELT